MSVLKKLTSLIVAGVMLASNAVNAAAETWRLSEDKTYWYNEETNEKIPYDEFMAASTEMSVVAEDGTIYNPDGTISSICIKCSFDSLTEEEVGTVEFILAKADENGNLVLNENEEPYIMGYDLTAEEDYQLNLRVNEDSYYRLYRMLLDDELTYSGFPTLITYETGSFTFNVYRRGEQTTTALDLSNVDPAVLATTNSNGDTFLDLYSSQTITANNSITEEETVTTAELSSGRSSAVINYISTLDEEQKATAQAAFDAEYFDKFTLEQWQKAAQYMITLRNEYMEEEFRNTHFPNFTMYPCFEKGSEVFFAETFRKEFLKHNNEKEWENISQNERVLWYFAYYLVAGNDRIYDSFSMSDYLKTMYFLRKYDGGSLYGLIYSTGNDESVAEEFEPIENYLCEIYEFVYSTYKTAGEPIDIWVAEKYYNLGFFDVDFSAAATDETAITTQAVAEESPVATTTTVSEDVAETTANEVEQEEEKEENVLIRLLKDNIVTFVILVVVIVFFSVLIIVRNKKNGYNDEL